MQALWNKEKLEHYEDWSIPGLPYALGYGQNADQWVLVKTISNQSPLVALLHEEYKWLELQAGPCFPQPLLWQEGRDFTQAVYLVKKLKPLSQLAAEGGDLKQRLEWALQVADALIDIHRQGSLFLACSPHNCLIRSDGEGAYFWDWTQVFQRKEQKFHLHERSAHLSCHAASMAPELQASLLRPPTLASDVYSYAVSLLQLLCGKIFDEHERLTDSATWLNEYPRLREALLPRILLQIIVRACEKHQSKRYQTIWGLRADLREVYAELCGGSSDLDVELGRRDVLDVLSFSQDSLYGRDVEIATLDVAFGRFMQGESVSTIVLGGAGIGKTALISHFMQRHKSDACLMTQVSIKALAATRPFAPLLSVLENLVGAILLKPQSELLAWRKKILDGVGENIALMVDLIPDLGLVLEQPEKLLSLPLREETIRFEVTFRNFLSVFCQKEHPLLIHLAEGQWLDADSCGLLRAFLEKSRVEYFFLIVSYLPDTDNARCALPSLQETLANGFVHSSLLPMQPLHRDSIARFLSNTLSCEQDRAEDLATLVYQKTKGVPALVRSMLKGLWAQGTLTFDYRSFSYLWNLSEAQKWQIDEGLIQALVKELNSFAPDLLAVLGAAACFLREFTPAELNALLPYERELVGSALTLARSEGLLLAASIEADSQLSLSFVHEEIRREAYRRLPSEQRRRLHRSLAMSSQAGSDAQLHYTVEQFNLSYDPKSHLADTALAEINLKLARRLRNAASFAQALHYLKMALQWLGGAPWSEHYRLTLSLYEETATTAYLYQDQQALVTCIEEALRHIKDPRDTLVIHEMQMVASMQGDMQAAFAIALPVFHQLGMKVPLRPSRLRAHYEVFKTYVQFRLAGRIDERTRSPQLMYDVALRMASRIASKADRLPPHLSPILWSQAMRLGLKQGALPSLPSVYVHFARLLIARYGLFKDALRLANSAAQLTRYGDDPQQKNTVDVLLFGFIYPWQTSLRSCLVGLLRAFRGGLDCGAYESAAQAITLYSHYSFASGSRLDNLVEELNTYRSLVADLGDKEALWHSELLQQLLVYFMQGEQASAPLQSSIFSKSKEHLERSSSLRFYHDLSWLTLQVYFHQPETAVALHVPVSWEASRSYACVVFYEAMHSVRLCETAQQTPRQTLRQLRAAQRHFKAWQRHATDLSSASHRLLLLEAEIARWQGQPLKALSLFTAAIQAASAADVQHEKALALEQLAQLFFSMKLQLFARDYLEQALQVYRAWGAMHLVSRLEVQYAAWDLAAFTRQLPQVQSDSYGLEYLQRSLSDITRETDPKHLIEKILQTAVHMTQAERGHFIMKSYDEKIYRVKQSFGDGLESYPDVNYTQVKELCRSLVSYVMRTRRTAVINDAQMPQKAVPGLERDPYVLEQGVRSLACLPIEIGNSRERELVGFLYLENNSLSHVFTADRLQFLALIGQAAAGRLEISEKAHFLEESLKEAQLVQRALLPNIPQLTAFTIADYFKPAEHTGGDWYGYYEDDKNHRAYFFIGDVTGHGVSSALITGTAAGAAYSAIAALEMLQTDLNLSETLGIVAHAVNHAVYTTAAKVDKLMTMVFIGFDPRTGELALINAAHPHGFIMSKYKARPLMGRGSPLGYSAEPDYQAQTFQLMTGDCLFFYSDGLMENQGPEGERLPSRALVKILESSQEPSEIKNALLTKTHVIWQDARAEDDFAFVILRWNGDPATVPAARDDETLAS